jgi:hypothetical protein
MMVSVRLTISKDDPCLFITTVNHVMILNSSASPQALC